MTRDQRLITIFALAAVLSTALVATRILTRDAQPRPPTPAQALVRQVPAGPDGALSLTMVGDLMLGDAKRWDAPAAPAGFGQVLRQQGYDWTLAGVRPLLNADFAIANAQAPITSLALRWNDEKPFSYNMSPPAATALARAGLDALGLASGHVMDRGPNGLADTFAHAAAAGLDTFGAGVNPEQARRPLLIRSEAGTVAVVGFGDYFGRDSSVASKRPGAMVLEEEDIDKASAEARAAGADWVVAFVTWGDNYSSRNGEQRYWAEQFARAGYTMVVGQGSHVVQPVEVIAGTPVVYGLGDFVFGSPIRPQDKGRVGLVATVELKRNANATLALRCVSTDNGAVRYQTRPCAAAQARAVLPPLHRNLVLRGETATLTFAPRNGVVAPAPAASGAGAADAGVPGLGATAPGTAEAAAGAQRR